MGDMADAAMESEWADEFRHRNYPECQYCGFHELEWVKTERGWRLHHFDGNLHICLKRKEKPVRIEKEHIGKYVKASTWDVSQKVKVLRLKNAESFIGKRGSKEGMFVRGDGSNAWEILEAPIVSDTKFETFWTLWQPASEKPVTRKFFDKAEAFECADLMTRRHKVEFYVMKSEALCQVAEAPITWQTAKGKK